MKERDNMTAPSASASGPRRNFFDQLLSELETKRAPEPTPPTPEELAAATADLGDVVQDLAAIAIGVRTRAVEAGIAAESADAMALSTYASLLHVNLVAANG